MAYNSPGPYQNGVWLVGQNGKGAIVDKAHLPSGSGYQYYWLGATESQANDRLPAALGALGIATDQIPLSVATAFQKGIQNLNFDQLQPFLLPGQSPSPNSGYAQAIHSAGDTAHSLASALSLSGIEELAVRILEALAGFALILLGLQALTGRGDGNPLTATRRVVRKVT